MLKSTIKFFKKFLTKKQQSNNDFVYWNGYYMKKTHYTF